MRVRDNSYANVYPEYGIPSDVSGHRSEYEKAKRSTARAKKAENEKIFHDNYDPRMTWRENLANLKGLGMKISKTKLYELINEYYPKPIQETLDEKVDYHKLSKPQRAKRQAKRDARKANDKIFQNNYNPKLSVKDNLKVLKDLGMKISKTKLYELIKKYNNDTEIFEERMANRN